MSKRNDVAKFVSGKLHQLQAISETGSGKARLAELRRGVGKEPGELPTIYGIILEDMPEDFFRGSGIPTEAEWACYVALTLFAWHQQGNDLKSSCMHTEDKVSLGTALRELKNASKDVNAEERLLKKLRSIATAMDMKGFSYHMRGLVKLFANNNIELNYILLATDIYEWQFEDSRNVVNLRWGQDYYRKSKEEEENE